MNRTIETLGLDLVDLGAASVETKGAPGGVSEADGRILEEGISED